MRRTIIAEQPERECGEEFHPNRVQSREARKGAMVDDGLWPVLRNCFCAELDSNASGLSRLRESLGEGVPTFLYSLGETRLDTAMARNDNSGGEK